jgi:hypothetical protein
MFKRQKELTEDVKQGGTLSLRTTDRLANRQELDMFFKRLEDNLDARGYRAVSKNNDSRDSDKSNSDILNQGNKSTVSTIEISLLNFFELMPFWLVYMETYGKEFLIPSFVIYISKK